MARKKEYAMSNTDWKKHEEFINYWNDTNSAKTGQDYIKKTQ